MYVNTDKILQLKTDNSKKKFSLKKQSILSNVYIYADIFCCVEMFSKRTQ